MSDSVERLQTAQSPIKEAYNRRTAALTERLPVHPLQETSMNPSTIEAVTRDNDLSEQARRR